MDQHVEAGLLLPPHRIGDEPVDLVVVLPLVDLAAERPTEPANLGGLERRWWWWETEEVEVRLCGRRSSRGALVSTSPTGGNSGTDGAGVAG